MDDKKRITPDLLARTDRYHDEFNRFYLDMFHGVGAVDKRNKFIANYKDEFPRLLSATTSLKIPARQIFDKYIYSLRDRAFRREPLPTHVPREGW